MEVGVGVGALRLVAGAPVIVPDWKIFNAARFGVQGLGLVPDTLTSPINPDITGLNPGKYLVRNLEVKSKSKPQPSFLLQLEILRQNCLVGLSVQIHI